MKIPRIALILALLAAPMLQAQAACDCLDQADLKKRIALVGEAMKAYGREFQKLSMTPYTSKIRKDLQNRVNESMSVVSRTQGLRVYASGGTDNLCQIHVLQAPTPCMAEGIRRHELVHQKACEMVRGKVAAQILSGKATDRFDALNVTMATYIQEEIEGYSAELQFLQSELQRLQRICKPMPTPGGGRDYSSRPPQTEHDSSAPNNAPGAVMAPPPVKGPKPLKAPAPIKAPPMPKPAPLPNGG